MNELQIRADAILAAGVCEHPEDALIAAVWPSSEFAGRKFDGRRRQGNCAGCGADYEANTYGCEMCSERHVGRKRRREAA